MKALLAGAAIALTGTPLLAQDDGAAPEGEVAARFAAMDANSDGRVDRTEWRAAMAAVLQARVGREGASDAGQAAAISDRMFALIDADADGSLTLAEVSALRSRMREQLARQPR